MLLGASAWPEARRALGVPAENPAARLSRARLAILMRLANASQYGIQSRHLKEAFPLRTTMTLDDRLVKELMALTGAKSRTEAIHTAIAELIRRKKREGLKALSGQVRIADDWRKNEEIELKEQAERERRTRGRR